MRVENFGQEGESVGRTRSTALFQPGIRLNLLLILAIALADCASWEARAQSASEYEVKAAYLYNFAKFAEWPETSLLAGAPLVIGIVGGDDEFLDVVQKTVLRKTVGGHPISAKRAESIAELDFCHLIFFRSSTGHKRIQSSISAMHTGNILLVGEEDGFLRDGGMINLVLTNGRVHFDLDRSSLDRAGIRLSPALLALASVEHGTEKRRETDAAAPAGGDATSEGWNTSPISQHRAKNEPQGCGARRGFDTARRNCKGCQNPRRPSLLADALAKAVMSWRYEPATRDSQVVVRFAFGQ